VAVAVAAPVAWADQTGGAKGATAHSSTQERFVLSWTVQATGQDIAPTGLSSGDTLQATFTLTGTRTGSADFACIAVGQHYLCQGIIRLADGDIYAQTGPVAEDQPAAIVGGTRRYDGVRGQFTQQEHDDGTGSWTLDLRG
jgi:hypothetical protein